MKTYCPMPWVGVFLLPGNFHPCCIWDDAAAFSDFSDLTEMLNSNKLQQVRNDMLEGRPVSGCSQCYNDEKLGIKSPRLQYIDRFGIVTKPELKSLDLAADNLCNLKCRGCCSSSSHLWYEDEQKLYNQTVYPQKYTKTTSLDQIEIDHLENITLTGGEPFLNKENDKFFQRFIDKDIAKNITFTVDTNGTVEPSDVMKTFLKEVKRLVLNISIDGIGDLNKYFRSGADWDLCIKNLTYFDSLYDSRTLPTIIGSHTTVSIYNVNKLQEIEDFFKEHFPRIKTSRRLLYWPEFLSIKNMPQELKDRVADSIKPYPEISKFLNSPGEDTFEHFLNFHDGLDSIRNEQLTSNDLLNDYINEYKISNPDRINSKPYWPKHIKLLTK